MSLEKSFTVRISAEDYQSISKIAHSEKTSPSAIARIYIRDGLAQFDRKHEELMENVAAMQLQIVTLQRICEQSNILTAANLAAVSLLDINRINGGEENGRVRLKGNVQTSLTLGKSLIEAHASGSLDKDI